MVIFHLFGKSILNILSGQSEEQHQFGRKLRAKASRNIPSEPGREEYVRVKLEDRDGILWADPIFGKSGVISNLVNADGLIRIAINDEGLEKEEEGEVILI
jgi:molybdopterin molybdotransferase